MSKLKYQRVLLKISGEGLSGIGSFGLAGDQVARVAAQIAQLTSMAAEVAVVVGAGNFIRGAVLSEEIGIGRACADQMGMLATVINSMALQEAIELKGAPARVLSAVGVTAVCEPFVRRRALKHLEKGRVIVLAGGTGNPFFTTDTSAALRALEIQADVIIKATKVDGVFSADPVKNPDAKLYDKLTFDEVLQQKLKVMDHSAITMCRDSNIDIIVCNLMTDGTIARVVRGEKIGTLVSNH